VWIGLTIFRDGSALLGDRQTRHHFCCSYPGYNDQKELAWQAGLLVAGRCVFLYVANRNPDISCRNKSQPVGGVVGFYDWRVPFDNSPHFFDRANFTWIALFKEISMVRRLVASLDLRFGRRDRDRFMA